MCFDPDSTPPIDENGAAVSTDHLVLEASDGNRFAAFRATPDAPSAAVVILPDVRGLFRFYEELAIRFAEAGHDAIAIDYFGRTAGVGTRDADFSFREHVDQTTYAGVRADVAAAVSRLRTDGADRPVFTVGFCFGGSNPWAQASNGHALAGAIGFYGHPDRERPPGAGTVIDRVPEMTCPVLGLMGGADPSIPADAVERFDRALTRHGIEHEIVSYPGAPHSFFDRKHEEFSDESADAWQRVLAFIDTHR